MEKGLTTTSSAQAFAMPEQYEYLLVVHPSEDVYAQVMQEKQHFFNTYHEKVAIKTLPHITVANFMAKELMEDTIIRYMHRILSTVRRFDITLNNFSGFPPHTIYTRVQDHKPFKQLANALSAVDMYVRSNGCPPAKFIHHPHVTISRRLKTKKKKKAMFEFSQRMFHASFTANELVLLKRQNLFDKCRQVNVFRLL